LTSSMENEKKNTPFNPIAHIGFEFSYESIFSIFMSEGEKKS
jgi:hypothetical protein